MNAIELNGIRRQYDLGGQVVHAIRAIDITVRVNEYVAVMGASGSGKSSLLNIVGLLDTPTAGEYLLGGHDVSRLSEEESARIRGREIGFVFQSFNLLPKIDIVRNVMLPLTLAGVGRAEARDRARAELIKMGLENRLGHFPGQLSGGQKQRVAIARALCIRPRILLADEPTGSLDSVTSEEIMQLFDDLHAQGQTIVMVTHDPTVASRCKRVVRMRDGLVERDCEGAGRC